MIRDGEDDDSDVLDEADDDGDSDLDVALRRLEILRQEIVSLRQRVQALEQGNGQYRKGSGSRDQPVQVLMGAGPRKGRRGPPHGRQQRIMEGIR